MALTIADPWVCVKRMGGFQFVNIQDFSLDKEAIESSVITSISVESTGDTGPLIVMALTTADPCVTEE